MTRRVTELGQKAILEQELVISCTPPSKAFCNTRRRRENPVLAADLASQMFHNGKTAERHYHVKDEISYHIEDEIRYLEEATEELASEQPSTSREHALSSSSSDEGTTTLMERFGKRQSQERKT